ncbi:MAG: hypothetical protein KKC19_02890 [Nanoarchaeota archaeon]|nr:hypothetical protein [Nanoarchaeota archaeon]
MDEDRKPYALEYLKSALSVNTHVGCVLGCEYCVVDEFAPGGIGRIYSPEEAVDTLLGSTLFIPEITPITLNNRTDPLLPEVSRDTFEMVRILNEKGIRNPRVIVSKLHLKKEGLRTLEDSCAETYFFVTYSNLPSPVERVPHRLQRESLKTLSEGIRVHPIHYWRPLIQGLNDDVQSLEEVLRDVSPVCEGSVLSGLRLDANIAQKVVGFGGNISGWAGDTKHKYLPTEIVEKILELRDAIFSDYPLYRHTSCAICVPQGIRDYNFHFLKPSNCLPGCPNVNNCTFPDKPSCDEIDHAISVLGLKNSWHFDGTMLRVSGSMNEEERSCISHQLGYPIVVENIIRAPSEEVIRR